MVYKILLSKKVEKQLNKISNENQKSIATSIEQLVNFSVKNNINYRNIKKLKTPFPGYRKRVGNYRILFEVVEKECEIKIYKIGHRKDIYKI